MNATSILQSTLQSTRSLVPFARPAPPSRMPHFAARALGLVSIALGVVEMASPARLAAQLGLDGKERLLRSYGGREIAAGIAALGGFLAPAMWARVFGDLVDLATLAVGRRSNRNTARNITIALGAVAGIALLDICVASLLSSRARR